MKVTVLGKPTIVQMRFKSTRDEEIPVGTLVILWDSLPCIKIGRELYEVYKDCTPIQLQELERTYTVDKKECTVLSRFIPDELHEDLDYQRDKYIKTMKGTRKRNFWESPKFL